MQIASNSGFLSPCIKAYIMLKKPQGTASELSGKRKTPQNLF